MEESTLMISSERSPVEASPETRWPWRHDLTSRVFRALTALADIGRCGRIALNQSGTTVGLMATCPRRTEPPFRRAT